MIVLSDILFRLIMLGCKRLKEVKEFCVVKNRFLIRLDFNRRAIFVKLFFRILSLLKEGQFSLQQLTKLLNPVLTIYAFFLPFRREIFELLAPFRELVLVVLINPPFDLVDWIPLRQMLDTFDKLCIIK